MKHQSPTLLLVLGLLLGTAGCAEPTGACVSDDPDSGRTYYCFEDETEEDCEYTIGSETVTWTATQSCADVGYPFLCTFDEMYASPSGIGFAVERYLSNAGCDPAVP